MGNNHFVFSSPELNFYYNNRICFEVLFELKNKHKGIFRFFNNWWCKSYFGVSAYEFRIFF